MSWPASIFAALLTATVAAVVGGVIAALAVDWYRISGFEGKSGYFVISIILVGFVAGLLIGLVTSRVITGGAHPTFLKGLGYSLLIVLGIGGVITGIVRFAADVPPKIAGQELLLAVEIRWPATQTHSPASDTVKRRLRLFSVSNRTARGSTDGPLWLEDAHMVDGHWVVPGAVEVWTSKGDRMLSIEPALDPARSFLVPLPSFPGKAQLAWSEWMPRARPGAPPMPDGLSMRFKVVPRNEIIRTQTFGAFEIGTVATGFYAEYGASDSSRAMATHATFRVRYRGAPVVVEGPSDTHGGPTTKFHRADAVALLPGAPDGLLVRPSNEGEVGPYYLVLANGERVRTEMIADGAPSVAAPLVTNDEARFKRGRAWVPLTGTVDERTYAEPGDYLFEGALLSTQPPRVQHFAASSELRLDGNVRPLGLSPDGRRIVRFGFGEDYKSRSLVVTDVVSGESSFVPVDVAHTRISNPSDLDPAWLQYYFEWVKGSGDLYTLAAKPNVTPLAYRGVTSRASDGNREYRLSPAGNELMAALTKWLEAEMHGTRTPEDVAAYGYQVHIDDKLVHVINNESEHKVSVYMDYGADTQIVETIGERFNAELATGKYDALFTQKE